MKIIMEKIELNKRYKPLTIAEKGFVTTMSENVGTNYKFVLSEIKLGHLKANNYCRGDKQVRYYILGSEIVRYRRDQWGLRSDTI